jgi:K+-sensing histidine kinase KdpD
MHHSLSIAAPVEREESPDWEQLTPGIAGLLADRSERNADVLNDVAHQLRTPVAMLRSHAARLEQAADQSRPDVAREMAERIVEQADLMAHWVSVILEVQRIRLGKVHLQRRRIALVELARRCVARFRKEMPDVEVQFIASPRLAQPMIADASQLSRVLDSLLRNAARYASGSAIQLCAWRPDWSDGCQRAVLNVSEANRRLRSDDLQRIFGCHSPMDLELFVARESIRLCAGELWTEQGGSASILVIPLEFPPRSHAILVRNAPCSALT